MELTSEALRERMPELFRYALVGRCVSGVTHDVNNYLGAIMAYAELAGLDEALSEETRGMLGNVISAASKCSEMINGLTSVARKTLQNVGAAEMGSMVNMVAMLRAYDIKVAGIKLSVENQQSLPSQMLDLPHIHLALLHLFLNAQDAAVESPDKCIRVRTCQEDDHIVVSIWNSGPVLDAQAAEAVFLPYVTDKAEYHIGFGLPQARAVAVRHGGTLTYCQERGFVLSLPLRTPLHSEG